MSSIKNSAMRTSALLIILSVILSLLCSCGGEVKSKQELTQNVENSSDSLGYSNVSSHLNRWGFPSHDSSKLRTTESFFKSYYVGELPDETEIAKKTALYFLEEYYDNIDLYNKAQVTDAYINSYINAAGDKYSHYMNPEDYAEYLSDMSGEFCGIGINISYSRTDDTYEIIAVFDSSPAKEAGILPGDFLVGVNGVSTEELGYDGTTAAIRGDEGTSVTVTVLRGEQTLDFTMNRKKLEDITVISQVLEGNIGYIRISQFVANTAHQFKGAIDELTGAGVRGIIFDLRSNPGGYLNSIIEILDYILPDGGDIVGYEYYDGTHETTKAQDGHSVSLPFAVLCNEYTASAAELFTSALRDYAKEGIIDATIIGTTTYKKGTMQTTFTYSDGSAITVSIALYNPPCGINYEGIGITPDIVKEQAEGEDTQFNFALEYMLKK